MIAAKPHISPLSKTFKWVVTLVLPVFLILSAVRLLIHPWYIELEYRTPGFPADQYGLNFEQRLELSRQTIEYLRRDYEISYLRELRFPEGQAVPEFSCQFMDDCTRLYNERELEHMLDVKNLVEIVKVIWWVCLGLLALAGLALWRGANRSVLAGALRAGGRLTVILTGAVILFAVAAFGIIFVAFHQVFFDSGTWTFYYTDTLIRLYPERFWRDTFLWVAGLPALVGAVLGFWGGRKKV